MSQPALQQEAEEFPLGALLPKDNTGALRFLAKHPEYDGRNVVVAIFDTGVDPGANYLQVTPGGQPKIIDIIDATGSGDVDMSTRRKVVDGRVQGLSGRTLVIPVAWGVESEVRLGSIFAYDFFPEDLRKRLKEKRKEKWEEAHRAHVSYLRAQLAEAEARQVTAEVTEINARLAALADAERAYIDPGPLYDVLAFHDGATWRVAVDVSESGDLSATQPLADYKLERKYSTFSEADSMNYSVKVYEDGDIVSIVCTAGSHGTHVASIVAAHDPDNPDHNGLAPGAQIVSVKIGDSRLGSMETGTGLVRGLIATLENKCDMINLSYGEAASTPDVGRFVELAEEVVQKHGVVFVASAGNNGPALSSVGCPGGTSSSIIGVAAYVTGPMMAAAYSLREIPRDMAYTWSSRGPAPDGDLGVSICAPGGAITSVPNWTLKKGQLMNGTSMSSPNACGAIALMLSGLKAQGVTYSPISIRRALENTAAPVPGASMFDVGHGLIQIDQAFEHVLGQVDSAWQHVRMAVSTRTRNVKGRGVYLRDGLVDGSTRVVEATVTIAPQLPERASVQDKIGFELNLRLAATQPWIQAPSNLALMNEDRSFSVQIDTRSLAPGCHYGEVCGFDTTQAAAGPLFRVPVTAIVSSQPSEQGVLHYEGLTFTPGQDRRFFVLVPHGASWVEVQLTAHDFTGSRRFALHLQQLAPHTPYRDLARNDYPTLESEGEWRGGMRVKSGAVLEACLTQWWSSLGDSTISMRLDFRGVLCGPVAIPAGETVARVDITSLLKSMTLSPTAALDKWTRALRPSASVIKPLSPTRDVFPHGRRIYALTLTYNFSQKDKGQVRPYSPLLSSVLYESAYEGQLWQLFDSRKRRLAVGDAFPSHYQASLPKGDYVLLLQVRHESLSLLEKLTSAVLLLERPLKDNVTLEIYERHPVTGGGKLSSLGLGKGGQACLYLSYPGAEPSFVQPGDFLSGRLVLLETQPKDSKYASVPVVYHVGPSTAAPAIPASPSPPAPVTSSSSSGAAAASSSSSSSSSSSAQPADDTLENALLNTEIAWLPKLSGDAFTAAYRALCERHPRHLALRQAGLKAAMDANAKEPVPLRVLAAADEVIALIDQAALAQHFGRRVAEHEKTSHATHESTKKTLISALSQKALALLQLLKNNSTVEHEGVSNATPSERALQIAAKAVQPQFPALMWRPGAAYQSPSRPSSQALGGEKSARLMALLADAVEALSAWTDVAAEEDLLELYVMYELYCGRGGAALQAVQKAAAEPTKSVLQLKHRLYAFFGWQHLIWAEETLYLFPNNYALF